MADDLGKISGFFSDYRSWVTDESRRFEQSFSRLKGGYEEYRFSNMKSAYDFNIFRILGVAKSEVCHSAFLRELLDPNGTHGQGHLFFKELLGILAKNKVIQSSEVDSYTPMIFDDYTCVAEHTVDTGRLDIVVSRLHGEFAFCFFIENKVHAVDQPRQIERYWEALEKIDMPGERKKILYLTLDEKAPSVESISDSLRRYLEDEGFLHYISYENVQQFLESSLQNVQSPEVGSMLKRYIDILKNLKGANDHDCI